jgi:PadR family transcriptional regulator, regulatory protein PadR
MYSPEFLKGTLKPIILKLLSENKKMYGYQMVQIVKALTKEQIQLTEGALYPALHQLVDEGILITETENIGNRKRIYYSLSNIGKAEAPRRVNEMISFLNVMKNIFELELKAI